MSRRGFPERSLVIADYHVGIEADLRYECGVEPPPKVAVRRKRLLSLLDRIDADRLVVLDGLGHRIGDPDGDEAEELRGLAAVVADRTESTAVPGNRDGGLVDSLGDSAEVTDPGGVRLGDAGFCHGHTQPSQEVLAADVVCSAHEHPTVRLEDEVGGARKECVWFRGALAPEVFAEHHEVVPTEVTRVDVELMAFPASNDTPGRMRVSAPGQGFLSLFLPDGLADGKAYLLDGTRLDDYRDV